MLVNVLSTTRKCPDLTRGCELAVVASAVLSTLKGAGTCQVHQKATPQAIQQHP